MSKVFLLTEKQLKERIRQAVESDRAFATSKADIELQNDLVNLKNLQSQINPHFLYNALESIRGQAIIDNAPTIAEMALALANYFRYSISSKSDIATLREELSNVENYVKIQLFRFDNRFGIEIEHDDDEDVLDAILPKLTIQPIVENSIIHGFTRISKDACIRIQIIATLKTIKIIVSDNGVGMSESNLRMLNEKISNHQIKQDPRKSHAGIAMPNVDLRLKLLFGEEYGIHVFSIEGVGTDVEIFIPFHLSN